MKLSLPAALLISISLLPALSRASDDALTDTLKAFTRCDASFFKSLKIHRDAWSAHAALIQEKDTAWIRPDDRTHRFDNVVPLSNAPTAGDMKLLAYVNLSGSLGPLGETYYWGFIVDGNIDEVAHHLTALLEEPTRLQHIDNTYSRAELRVGDHWQPTRSNPGVPVGNQKTERLLYLEPEGEEGVRSRISCSLQGRVDHPLLAHTRPDMAPADYARTDPMTYTDDFTLADKVQEQLHSPLLRPRFKTLSYEYLTEQHNAVRGDPVSVTLTEKDGVLHKREIYNHHLHVERLTLADLVQLSSQATGAPDGRALLNRTLELKIPDSWRPGETLSVRQISAKVPANPGDKPFELSLTCQVGQRFPARDVFATLPGDAVMLTCQQDRIQTTYAFIEDLGVAMMREAIWPSVHYTYPITALTFTR